MKHAENNQIIITIVLLTIFYHIRLSLATTTPLDKIGFFHWLIFLMIGHNQKLLCLGKYKLYGDANKSEALGKH